MNDPFEVWYRSRYNKAPTYGAPVTRSMQIAFNGGMQTQNNGADDLADLRAENAKLREALGKIVVLYDNLRDHRIPMTQGEYDMMDIARAALA